MPVLFDTHCHPQFPQYDADRESVLRRALDAGVGMIAVGTDYEMSQKAIELAAQYENVWASVGLHPNDNLNEKYDQGAYEELAQNKKVIAIGEVGLDYYRTTESEKQKFQRDRFEQQLDLAVRLKKPVIIHCRNAHQEMIAILENSKLPARRSLGAGGKIENFSKGVIHSFTGTYVDAKKYIQLGFFIGLNGIITFARQYDDTVMDIPLESILLETDAPYLTPEPYRGKRNEPAYVTYVAEQVARLRRMPVERVMAITTKNAREVFGLDVSFT